MRTLLALILVVCAGLTAAQAAAAPGASPWVARDFAEIRLIAAATATGARDSLPAGLHIRLQPGWKVYWRSAGDAGFPPSLEWAGSTNLAGAEMAFPVPKRFSILGLQSYGYGDEVVYPLRLAIARPGAPLSLRARMRGLMCKEICLPLEADLSLDLPAGAAAPSAFAQLIDRFRARVPGDLSNAGLRVTAVDAIGAPPDRLRVRLSADAPLVNPDVFPEGPDGVTFGAPERRFDNDRRTATLTLPLTVQGRAPVVGAAFRVTAVDGDRFVENRLTAGSATATRDWRPLWTILALAVLGGFILNLMPCVLPVLSLKLMSVATAGALAPWAVRRGFLAAAAGVVVAFWGLAGAAIAMKHAGLAVGWGIQFQQPVFLALMIALLALFAANLWGVFDIPLPRVFAGAAERLPGAPSGGGTLTGHFMTGAFATVLATPCSAPFLGTAVGFALARGSPEILAIFTLMGIGMAAPYLVVAAAPGMARALPRPGPWMAIFKRGLAVALIATAAWLGSVLWAQSAPVVSAPTPGWSPFSRAELSQRVTRGAVVLVDVTADWCLTCKVNKAAVLDTGRVAGALAEGRISGLRADWTQPDPKIAAYLAGFGRYGIPFNAVYGPAAPAGIALPEVLTESAVMAAIVAASGRQ